MRKLPIVWSTCAVFVWFVLLSLPVHAQSINTDVSLELEPRYPTPGSVVTVSLNAYSMDTIGASIMWYVDKKELTNFKNERSITVTVGDAGKPVSVVAVISKSGFAPVAISNTIVPSVVDIVIEAQTYVPYFYTGRALPSAGAPIRAIAVFDDGKRRNPATYSYLWTLNDNVLFGGSIKGKQSINLTMPEYRDNILEVSVIDAMGRIVGTKVMGFSPYDAHIEFYESVPLRGESERAVSDSFVFTGDETSFVAEPFFMSTNMKDLTFAWKLNGESVTPNKDMRSMTLRRVGGGGRSTLSVEATSIQSLLQYASGSFGLIF